MDFGKWLKENKQFDVYGSSLKPSKGLDVQVEELVSVQALGEFRLNERIAILKERVKRLYEMERKYMGKRKCHSFESWLRVFTVREIEHHLDKDDEDVACLGHAEVSRRLKEMGK